jgi:hypothetical protein
MSGMSGGQPMPMQHMPQQNNRPNMPYPNQNMQQGMYMQYPPMQHMQQQQNPNQNQNNLPQMRNQGNNN